MSGKKETEKKRGGGTKRETLSPAVANTILASGQGESSDLQKLDSIRILGACYF